MWGKHPKHKYVLYKVTPKATTFRYFKKKSDATKEGQQWCERLMGKRKTCRYSVKKRPTW